MLLYVVVFVVAFLAGLVVEQKFDLLKPKHIRIVEKQLMELRSDIRSVLNRR